MTPNFFVTINKCFAHFSIDSADALCIGLLTVASKNSAILDSLKNKFFFFIFFFSKKKKANTLVFMLENESRVNSDENLELAILETTPQ